MQITSDREVEVFNCGYSLGFRAGQLDKRKHDLAALTFAFASSSGTNIAITRRHISLEEYTQIAESHKED